LGYCKALALLEIKIKNPNYSQAEGLEEFFDRANGAVATPS
jgi:hypothetical protein